MLDTLFSGVVLDFVSIPVVGYECLFSLDCSSFYVFIGFFVLVSRFTLPCKLSLGSIRVLIMSICERGSGLYWACFIVFMFNFY